MAALRTNMLRASTAALVIAATVVTPLLPAAAAAAGTTAWQSGRFSVDVPGVVRSADIALGAPNSTQAQSMPLGNGTLGAAVWAANGFTAQLNRSDTLPGRKSPGWVTIPGLSKLTSASDFSGHVDLYDGTLYESGGGMTATIYVRADKDELVVDVTGADPNAAQTTQLNLWSGRSPQVAAAGGLGTLAETWVDNTLPGSSGQTFGSMAGLTVGGTGVTASTVDSETVSVSFKPHTDGTYRVVVAAPTWTGGDAQGTASSLIGTDATDPGTTVSAGHLSWWHSFWNRVGLVKMSSADGVADYMENLRTLDLYDAAASSRGTFPGSQAGVADLFNPYQDAQQWDPADWWHWNLRMQTQANITSGAFDLNAPYFNLYAQNLAAIQNWTQTQMGGRAGICVPETMRFNGNGVMTHLSNGQWGASPAYSCSSTASSWYNTRTLSTGAEVGLWVWQQYQTTGDLSFLKANYPLMADAAQFLLAYAGQPGSDGNLHTYPSNAHETQWDVHDPTTDVSAEQALFPATIAAANLVGGDPALVASLTTAENELLPLPRTDVATQSQLLTAASDAAGQDVIAPSYDPSAAKRNSENIGLEPVWPYGLIGDSSPLTALAQRTYTNRPNKLTNDWNLDPLDAARLGLGSEVASTLSSLTQKYQKLPSGLAQFVGTVPYGEQQGVVAATLNESLVQDYDGLLRIAPALPTGWDADGTVFIHGGSTVSVQVHGGVIGTVGINAGSNGSLTVRNPWPGRSVEVVDGGDETTVIAAPTTAAQITFQTTTGHSYLVQPVAAPVSGMTVSTVTAPAATRYRTLGSVAIGTANTVTVTNPGTQTSTQNAAITPLQIAATDSNPSQTLTYSAAGLPAGLSINATGSISGTPTTAGSSTVTVTATDNTGTTGTATFTWTVGAVNLIPAGNFESGNLSGWTVHNATIVTDAAAHSPTHDLQLKSPAGDYATMEYTVTGLTPNTKYTFSGWVRADSGASTSFGVKNFGGTTVTAHATATGWTPESDTFTTGATNTTATVYCYLPSGSATSTCDDLSLTAS